jgi:hypothetical protein
MTSYNPSVVKIYNATKSIIVHLENEILSSTYLENAVVCYNITLPLSYSGSPFSYFRTYIYQITYYLSQNSGGLSFRILWQ